jgi:hypothetical protein
MKSCEILFLDDAVVNLHKVGLARSNIEILDQRLSSFFHHISIAPFHVANQQMYVLSHNEKGEESSTKAVRKRKLVTPISTNKRLPPEPPLSLDPNRETKPLPSPPCLISSELVASKCLPSKPLPAAPAAPVTPPTVNYRSTLLWLAFFCVWFLLIVLLLPLIMEKDAMPGLNRWLRRWVHDLIGGTGDEIWRKDEV